MDIAHRVGEWEISARRSLGMALRTGVVSWQLDIYNVTEWNEGCMDDLVNG